MCCTCSLLTRDLSSIQQGDLCPSGETSMGAGRDAHRSAGHTVGHGEAEVPAQSRVPLSGSLNLCQSSHL